MGVQKFDKLVFFPHVAVGFSFEVIMLILSFNGNYL